VNHLVGYEELMMIKDTPLGKEIIRNGKRAENYYAYIMPFVTALRKEVDDWHGDVLNKKEKTCL
jgi:hypothetical protein